MPAGTQLAERMWFMPDPIVLAPATRAILGKKMELYAGMVENLDFHIGRLIDHLKKIGEYENTIFVVFGDNGAEGTDLFKMIAGTPGTRDYLFAAINWSQTHPNAWGDPGSYVGYGPMWAQVSMTPFSQYKGWLAEGGIRNALVVSGPAVNAAQGEHQPWAHARGRPHADAARDRGHPLSDDARGARAARADGQVLGPDAGGRGGFAADGARTTLAWELFGNRAVRQGDWKLRWQYKPLRQGDWELFNLAADPAERKDLAAENPDKVRALIALWDSYVRTNNVVLPSRSAFETLEDQLPPRMPDDAGYPPLIYKRQFVPPKDLLADPKP